MRTASACSGVIVSRRAAAAAGVPAWLSDAFDGSLAAWRRCASRRAICAGTMYSVASSRVDIVSVSNDASRAFIPLSARRSGWSC